MSEVYTDKLYGVKDAFDFSENNITLFFNSMKEMTGFHIERSDVFREICKQYGFELSDLRSRGDVERIPHIFVTAFKLRKMISLPEKEIDLILTSSGTQGQKSQINLDNKSIERQAFMRESIVKAHGLASDNHANYLIFSYDPSIAGARGAAYTFQKYATFAPSNEKYFALQGTAEGEPQFDLESAIKTLIRFAETGLPLRAIGFLAFSYVTCKEMLKREIRLNFPEESLLLTGGGWKSHTGETVTFEQYAEIVNCVLGIHPHRIRDFYGMVEHGVPYISCSHGHFHIPIYANVVAVDPASLKVLPLGETGLLKLQTSYIRSAPAVSVLSTDLGAIGSDCKCGLKGEYLVLKGRAGVQKHAGCAISASQLIQF
jgi:hypothetical protein